MSNLDIIKENIMNVIKDNEYSLEDLQVALSPISIYTENPAFKNSIDEIVLILTKDRDGNNVFSIEDLKLLGNDFMGISSLITAIFLLIGSIPQMKLEYKPDETEEIIFKLLAYIFLVIVPKQTGNPWTFEQKEQVVSVSLTIYSMIKSSQLVNDLINKVKGWLKQKGFCKCLSKETESKLPQVKFELQAAMNNVHDKALLHSEIRELKARLH